MEGSAKKIHTTAPWNLDALAKCKDKEVTAASVDSDSDAPKGEAKRAARTKRDTFITIPNMTRTPRGTDFRWKHNQHIKKKPFVVGQPQELDLKLTDVTGNVWVFPPCEFAKNPDWGDPKWVAKANRWYDQVVIRRLDKAHPEDSTLRSMRPMWTYMEKQYLEGLIERRIRRVKNLLVADDWNSITKAFNERFENTTIRIGHPVAHATLNIKGPVKNQSLRRLRIKSPHILPARSTLSIRSQMYRWADTRKMVEDLLAEYGIENAGEHLKAGEAEEEIAEEMELTGEDDDEEQDDEAHNHKFRDHEGIGCSGLKERK